MRVKSTVLIILVIILACQITAQDTYFGKNKVRYKKFEWDYIQTRHFDIYFYDDIYPSILKQQPSHFKSLLLGLWLRFMHLWHKVCCAKRR